MMSRDQFPEKGYRSAGQVNRPVVLMQKRFPENISSRVEEGTGI
jgi:hypothetical protein